MATKQTEITPPANYNPFGALDSNADKSIEEQFASTEESIYYQKKHVYETKCEVVAFKMFFSTDPRRVTTIPAMMGNPAVTIPGVNVALELKVLEVGEGTTDARFRPGRKVNLFWQLDARTPDDVRKFDEMEIAQAAAAFSGRKPAEVYADLKSKGMAFFEDEEQYAGTVCRVYSKAAKKKKDGSISDLRNIGVELIEAAAPTLVEETAPAAPAPINTPVRRGTKGTTPAEAMPS